MNWMDFMMRILLAVLLGFLIGLERQITGHTAGIRINVLISMGSCLFLMFPIITGSDEVYRIAGSIAVYGHGSVDRVGDKWDLFRDPQTAVTARLTGCKNIAPARWEGDRVTVPDWGLTLAARHPGREVNCVGLRAHYLRGADRLGENVFRYQVDATIEDTFSFILMIRPADRPQAVPIRWELSKADYAALPPGQLAYIPPEALLPLRG